MRYEIVAQGGSSAVRKRALIAALDGEVKARRDGDAARAALVPANYEFTTADAPGDVLRVTLKPKRNDAMLIDGAMTLARDSGELLSIEGRLVKSPSFWTRQVHVTRRYARIAGVRVPVAMESRARSWSSGASTFDMSYRYLSINGAPVAPASRMPARRGSPRPDATRHDGRDGRPGQRGAASRARRRLPPAPIARRGERGIRRHARARSAAGAERGGAPDRRAPGAARVRHADRAVRAARRGGGDPPRRADHRVSPAVGRRHRLSGRQRSVRSRAGVGALPPRRHARSILDVLSRTDSGRRSGRRCATRRRTACVPPCSCSGASTARCRSGWASQSIEADAGETEAGFYPIGTPITLEVYNRGTYQKLATTGARAADHPLARLNEWPRSFTGTWARFLTLRSVRATCSACCGRGR